MKNTRDTARWDEREWAGAAAWFSGEENGDAEAAALLSGEDPELGNKWNSLKQPQRPVDVERAWERVNAMIEAAEQPPVSLLLHRRSLTGSLARIAAMVVLVTALGWLIFDVTGSRKLTVADAGDERNIEIVLADGSRVFLNSHSSLTYPKRFGEGARMVSLRGEAYFEITADRQHPFIIDAGKASIEVLGTTFNVITENGHNEVEVYVASGSVMVTGENGAHTITVSPEHIGKISAAGSSTEPNTNQNYLAWHTGMLTYDGERLGIVFKDLKRAFDLEIRAGDPEINDYQLTSPFEQQPNDTIVKLICTTFNLRYVVKDGVYTLYR